MKSAGKLKSGMKAPQFSFESGGKTIALSDFLGKKVILYFYPKDDTPGCTAQACSLRDDYSSLKKKGYVVIGVSADSEKSHEKFIDKYDLPFLLASDPDKEIIKKYNVWGKKKFMGREYMGIMRTTFIIDEQGKIERIIDKVDTKNHAAQVLEPVEL